MLIWIFPYELHCSSKPMEGDGEHTSRSHELLFVSARLLEVVYSQRLKEERKKKFFLQQGHGYGFGNNHLQ